MGTSDGADSTENSLHPALRYGIMVLVGPITLLGAFKSDFEMPLDQLVAGIAGTLLWAQLIMEVAAFV